MQPGGASPPIDLELVASGFFLPVLVTNAGDGSGRLFVVEKRGVIWVVENNQVLAEPFLDISHLVVTTGEQGLLGLAFHPQYPENGRFFVFYSGADRSFVHYSGVSRPRSVVAEYRVGDDPNRAHPEGRIVLEEPQPPQPLHRAGQLKFGPEGYLYIAFGDGRSSWQALSSSDLLGTIARIDIDGGDPYRIPDDNPFVNPDSRRRIEAEQAANPILNIASARGEIWAYGFRNPWRFSFDRCTGRLFVGDVGEISYEEINLVEPGRNYGWPVMEGLQCHPEHTDLCALDMFAEPLYAYPHLHLDPEGGGGNAVVGGHVYRGRDFPELVGRYFFADIASGRIWTLSEGPQWRVDEVFHRPGSTFVSFGEDEDGELYLVSINSGMIERIIVATGSASE